jgi:hypothetical protein
LGPGMDIIYSPSETLASRGSGEQRALLAK